MCCLCISVLTVADKNAYLNPTKIWRFRQALLTVPCKMCIASNGALSEILKNLIDSGFVKENQFFGKKKKDTLYQLADYYSCFYFL